MKLNRFLDMLTEVELSQHIFGQLDEDERLIKQYELINLINRGLEDIHTRFMLSKGELLLNVDTSYIYRYDLEDETHVLSADYPLNLIRILEVWDECGQRMSLNTILRSRSCMYNTENYVQLVNKQTLSFENACGVYRIVFHKGPNLIEKPKTPEEFKPERIELDISLEYIDALIFYVCSRLFSITLPMEGYAAQYSPGILYSRKYEEECERLKDLNFEIDGMGDSYQRFHDSMFP